MEPFPSESLSAQRPSLCSTSPKAMKPPAPESPAPPVKKEEKEEEMEAVCRRMATALQLAEPAALPADDPDATPKVVIDSGLFKDCSWDAVMELRSLVEKIIPTTSSDQRKGRCGRCGPGLCYRLWDSGSVRPLTPEPELLRMNLLDTLVWNASVSHFLSGISPVQLFFRFPSEPQPEQVEKALKPAQSMGLALAGKTGELSVLGMYAWMMGMSVQDSLAVLHGLQLRCLQPVLYAIAARELEVFVSKFPSLDQADLVKAKRTITATAGMSEHYLYNVLRRSTAVPEGAGVGGGAEVTRSEVYRTRGLCITAMRRVRQRVRQRVHQIVHRLQYVGLLAKSTSTGHREPPHARHKPSLKTANKKAWVLVTFKAAFAASTYPSTLGLRKKGKLSSRTLDYDEIVLGGAQGSLKMGDVWWSRLGPIAVSHVSADLQTSDEGFDRGIIKVVDVGPAMAIALMAGPLTEDPKVKTRSGVTYLSLREATFQVVDKPTADTIVQASRRYKDSLMATLSKAGPDKTNMPPADDTNFIDEILQLLWKETDRVGLPTRTTMGMSA